MLYSQFKTDLMEKYNVTVRKLTFRSRLILNLYDERKINNLKEA